MCPANADCAGPQAGEDLLDAAAYSPGTDTWRELPEVPRPVFHDLASWTGNELVILHHPRTYWPEERTVPATVSAYDPLGNSWRSLEPPPLDYLMGGLWTGEELIYWLSEDVSSSSYALDPLSGRWRQLPPDPLGPSFDRSMAWVGGELHLAGLRLDDEREPKVFQVTSHLPGPGH